MANVATGCDPVETGVGYSRRGRLVEEFSVGRLLDVQRVGVSLNR